MPWLKKLAVFIIVISAIFLVSRLFVSNSKTSAINYRPVNALGATVHLNEVDLLPDGRLKVKLTINPPRTMPQSKWFRCGEARLEYNGQQFQMDEGKTSSGDISDYKSTACFRLPQRAKTVTLAQKIYLQRPEKHLRLKFDNISFKTSYHTKSRRVQCEVM